MPKKLKTAVFAVFICCLSILVLSACGEKNSTSSKNALNRHEEYAYFTFPNVDWGITPDELCVALQKTQEDFVIEEIGAKRVFYIEMKFLNKTSTVSFLFDKSLIDTKEYLSVVQTGYEDMSDKDFEKLCADIETLITEQDVPISTPRSDTFTYYESENESDEKRGTEFSFSSVSTIDNLPSQMKEAYNNAAKDYFDKNPQSGIDPERIDFINAQKDIALSQINAKYFPDNSSYNIRITCGPFAAIKTTAQIYLDLQNNN